MWTEFIEVPVAILLHFVWREDGQGPVGVHGDHHTANVCLEGEEQMKQLAWIQHFFQFYTDWFQQLFLPSVPLGVNC